MNTMFSYSKLLRLFYIVHMFTSLRLEVVWRTEQVIFYYIHKSNERGRQLFVIVMPRGFQVGDRVHLERDCINFILPVSAIVGMSESIWSDVGVGGFCLYVTLSPGCILNVAKFLSTVKFVVLSWG